MLAWCIRNGMIVLALTIGLAVAGLWAWTRLPVDAIPDLSDNQVIVWADWPGKSAEDIDQQVTARLARGLQGLPGVQTVRGLSLAGTAYVYVIFEENRNLYECRTRTLERLAILQNDLPTGVLARLGPDATAMGQVFAFTLEGKRDTESKRRILDQVVSPALQGVPGVAEVAPVGGVLREYQIDVDPVRLEEQGMTAQMLMMAISRGGRDVGAMSVEQSGVETMIRGIGFIRDARDVENIVIKGNKARNAGLLLRDLATVTIGGAPRQGVLVDGTQEQVGAIIAIRVGEDPLSVIGRVKARLHELEPALQAEQLSYASYYDRSDLIHETNATLAHTLLEELLVTVLVVVVFLLHARGSLAVAIILPLGVLMTLLLMYLLGVSANIMSLAGIAIAIGVMVDFGIVMTENITQHLVALQEERVKAGKPPPRNPADPEVIAATIAGAREVLRPLVTAAATTIIGFLPLFVLDDQAGRLFKPLALTKTLAIGSAVLFGLLLVPLLCRLLLTPWQLRKPLAYGLAGIAAVAVFGLLWPHGFELPMDHGRWEVLLPGWLVAPLAAGLVGLLVWRLAREELVSYEDNPISHAIHIGYDWALTRILRHKVIFTVMIASVALTGWLLGVGWATLSTPLRKSMGWAGADITQTQFDATLRERFPGIGASFLPPLDEGALLFMPSLPAAAGLGETQRVLQIQNHRISQIPEVASVMGKMGRAESALDPAPIGMIETVVLLKPYQLWPLHSFTLPDGTTQERPRTLAELRQVLADATAIPGVAPSWLQPIETRVVMLSTGIKSLMALQLRGDNQQELDAFAESAEKIIAKVPGAVDVQAQREGGKPYAEIRLDAERMARFGIDKEQVMEAVETSLGGMPITYSVEGTKRYAVRLRYARERRDDPDELALLQVPVSAGHGAIPLSSLVAAPRIYTLAFSQAKSEEFFLHLPLDTQRNYTVINPQQAELILPAGEALPDGITPLASDGHAQNDGAVRVINDQPDPRAVTYTLGPMAIRSEGGKRTVYVLFNANGRPEVEVVHDAEARLNAALARNELRMPAGAEPRWVGRYEQKLKADARMTWVIGVALLVMIMLIYIGTQSALTSAIIILCNVSVTTAGGFIMVWAWGADMTTAVIVGFLVLLGVMFNDGILLGTYLHQQFLIPPTDIAGVHMRVFAAGLRRRRPALMTNLTTLLSLVPILWSDGRGAELMRPMVLPIIGGMLADLISLFSVPVFYAWVWEWRLRKK